MSMVQENRTIWKRDVPGSAVANLMLTAQVIHNMDNLPMDKRVDIYIYKVIFENTAKTKCLGSVKMKYLGDFSNLLCNST